MDELNIRGKVRRSDAEKAYPEKRGLVDKS
jgi:hypothetical protein